MEDDDWTVFLAVVLMVAGLEDRLRRFCFCGKDDFVECWWWWRFVMWGIFNCKRGWEFSLTQSPSSIRWLDFVALRNRSDVEEDWEDLRVPAEDSLMAVLCCSKENDDFCWFGLGFFWIFWILLPKSLTSLCVCVTWFLNLNCRGEFCVRWEFRSRLLVLDSQELCLCNAIVNMWHRTENGNIRKTSCAILTRLAR